MAPIDSNIIVLSNRVSSTFESTPLKHRQIGVSRINKCKFTFFFFSFFPFIFVNFVYFFFLLASFFLFESVSENSTVSQEADDFIRIHVSCIHRHRWTIFLVRFLSQLRGTYSSSVLRYCMH